MEYKKKIIIGSFVFIIILLILIPIISKMGKSDKIPFLDKTSVPKTTYFPWPSISLVATLEPTLVEEKIDIKGVKVRDFYQFAGKPNDVGDISIFESDDFQFVYQSRSSRFLIYVNNFPFDEIQKKAEKKFLEVLGISKEDACNLSVFVVTNYRANPEYAGKKFNLSFCNDD